MFNFLTNFLYNIKYDNYSTEFYKVNESVNRDIKYLDDYQNIALKKMIAFSYDHVEYYRTIFDMLNIKPMDIENVKDLVKIPIINKETIKNNEGAFYSNVDRKFQWSSTGGSTGQSFRYKLDKECSFYQRMVTDRGWGYARYKPGDKVLIFAGGSLVNKTNYKTKIINNLTNKHSISSYGITDNTFKSVYDFINLEKPKYIYAYVSSIYLFCLWLERNRLTLKYPPIAVFTTAEKLFAYQRERINDTLNTEVFDVYGLNDGGVSAHECNYHEGLHIDYERSILEIVDSEGNQISEGTGRIIATSLHNYAMPFIRYDTGDIGMVTSRSCKCGKSTPRLLEIIGRTTDYLKFDDVYIGSPVLTVLMSKIDVDFYQIVQDDHNHVTFKIVLPKHRSENYKEFCSNHIIGSMNKKVPMVKVDITFFNNYEELEIKNKHKFIVNNIL